MDNELLNKRKIVVAVIDSGMDTSIGDMGNYVKYQTGFIMNTHGGIVEDKDMRARHEHGTAIGMIIKSLCSNVEFISINILDEKLLSDGRLLIYSFKKAIELKPDVIHLSLGTTKFRYRFELWRLVRLAEKNNIIVVSALNNKGVKSYPACIKGVIKVGGVNLKGKEDFHYKKGTYYAPYNLVDIEGMNELVKRKMVGNSMAAAYITGHVCNIQYSNLYANRTNIGTYLKLKSIKF